MRHIELPERALPGRIDCVLPGEQSDPSSIELIEFSERGRVELPDDAMLIYTADDCHPSDLAQVSRDAFTTVMLTGVGDELLTVLGAMTGILHLQLSGGFTDAGLRRMDWSTDMFAVELDSPHIGPQLSLPGAHASLIKIHGDSLGDNVFDTAAAKNPLWVDIEGAGITGSGLGALAEARELEEVRIGGCDLQAENLQRLAEAHVDTLAVKPGRLDDEWVEALLRLPRLRAVDVSHLDPAPLQPERIGPLLAAGLEVNGIRAGSPALIDAAAQAAANTAPRDVDARTPSHSIGLQMITEQAEFEAQLARGNPVVLQLTAAWCGPCKQFRPVLEQSLAALDGVTGVIVDVDRSPWAEMFAVKSLPTVIAFVGGREVLRFAGARPGKDIIAVLAAAIAPENGGATR